MIINWSLLSGHNPAIIELVELLTGMAESIPTCALAHIKLPIKKWEELQLETKYELVKDSGNPKNCQTISTNKEIIILKV